MFTFFEIFCWVLSVLLILFCLVLGYIHRNSKYWEKRGISGPTPVLWYGTFPKASIGECNLVEELDELYQQYKSSHKYIGVFVAGSPKLFILDPMLAKQILTTHFKCFHDNESSKWTTPSVDPLRTQSPFVSVGDSWKEKRSELAPVLTAGRLRAFNAVLQESGNKLVKFVKQHSNKPLDTKEVQIANNMPRQLINRYTADFMSSYIWGIQTHDDSFIEGSFSDVQKMANKLIEQAIECVRYFGRTSNFPWLRRVFPKRFFPKSCDDFFQQMASYAIKMCESSAGVVGQKCVINHLLQLRDKKSLNEIQIAGHTTTILIDGFETGAIVSAHVLLLLARNPRVQHKLRDVLNTIDEFCTYDELNNLEYLDQCVNETLRIFPPLTTLFKLCTETFCLENKDGTKLRLQPDTGIYISSYSFQRDSEYYDQPESFWPERFDNEMGGLRKYQEMGVFLPFGDGPRICPGMKLGIAEVKMAVAKIVRHFRIRPTPKLDFHNKIAPDSFLLTYKNNIELIYEEI